MKIDDVLKSKFTSPMQRTMVNVRFTSNFLAHEHDAYMKEFGLTMPQFNILRILRGAKGAISVNLVKERMLEKSPNTTRLMDKLISKGLIARKRCKEDRRVVYVEISEKGLNLLSELDAAFKKKDILPKTLTDTEANTLSDLLDKLRG